MHQVDKATFLFIVFLAFVLYVGGFLFLNSTYLYTSTATIKRWSRLFIKKCGYTNVDFFLTELYKISLLIGMAAFSVFLLRAQVAVDVATAAALEVERLAAIALEAERLAALALEEARLAALKLSAAADLIKPTRPAWWAYAPLITVTAVGAIVCFPPLIHVFTFPGSLLILHDLLSTPQETLEALTPPGAEVYDPGMFVLVTTFVAPLVLVPACGFLFPWYAAAQGFIDPAVVVPAINALGLVQPQNALGGIAAALVAGPVPSVLELAQCPNPIGRIADILKDHYIWTNPLCRTFYRGAYYFDSLTYLAKYDIDRLVDYLASAFNALNLRYRDIEFIHDLYRSWSPNAEFEYRMLRDNFLDYSVVILDGLNVHLQFLPGNLPGFINRIVSIVVESTSWALSEQARQITVLGQLFAGA